MRRQWGRGGGRAWKADGVLHPFFVLSGVSVPFHVVISSCCSGLSFPPAAPSPWARAFSLQWMKLGRRFLLQIGLLCHATRSSVPGVSMATTKIILHKRQPRYKWIYLYFGPSLLLSGWLLPRLAKIQRGSVATPRHFHFGFSLSQEGWGRGVVKETGICNYLFIYLIFGF